MINVLAALGQPNVTAPHGQIEAGFVEKYELLDWDPGDGPSEGFAFGYDGRA
jgi:hypothetical protein